MYNPATLINFKDRLSKESPCIEINSNFIPDSFFSVLFFFKDFFYVKNA